MTTTSYLVHSILESAKKQNPYYLASNLISDSYPLIVYGHGEGYCPLERTILNPLGISPSIIIDRKYIETFSKEGIIYTNFNGFTTTPNCDSSSPVVITLGSKAIATEVSESFKELGYNNVYWAPDLYEYSLHHSTDSIDTIRENCIKESADIEAAFNLLADLNSQTVFKVILSRYLLGLPYTVPSSPFSEQYLGNDLDLPPNPDTYICCGAYDGDSIDKITKKFHTIKHVYALEPDPQNFAALSSYSKSHSISYPWRRITSLPLGVSSRTHLAAFSASSGLSTTLDPDGDTYLPLVALDDLLTSIPDSLLTMDVEGAEFDALLGSTHLISKYRPTLAISVYHYPSHLWTIVNYLASLDLSYKFHLRNYSGHTYESVLYAVPHND